MAHLCQHAQNRASHWAGVDDCPLGILAQHFHRWGAPQVSAEVSPRLIQACVNLTRGPAEVGRGALPHAGRDEGREEARREAGGFYPGPVRRVCGAGVACLTSLTACRRSLPILRGCPSGGSGQCPPTPPTVLPG